MRNLKGTSRLRSFEQMGSQKCLDHCTMGAVENLEGMMCECPEGMMPKFKPSCDHMTEDCFDGCGCIPGSNMGSTGQCVCDDNTMVMTKLGCKKDHMDECLAQPMSIYSKSYGVCRTYIE
jgi:hypothetical protein